MSVRLMKTIANDLPSACVYLSQALATVLIDVLLQRLPQNRHLPICPAKPILTIQVGHLLILAVLFTLTSRPS